jgi:hypothetical protein
MSAAALPASAEPTGQLAPQKRRGTELLLLLAALVVGIGAYVTAEIGYGGQIPDDLVRVAGGSSSSPCSRTWRCGCSRPMPTRCSCRWSSCSTASAWR